jgi:uncharacterized protein (TIGR03790 family)
MNGRLNSASILLCIARPAYLQASSGVLRHLFVALLFVLLASPPALSAHDEVRIELSRTALTPEDIGVVVNDDDPLSRRIGEYYRKARRIPASNVVHVNFTPGRETLSEDEFQKLKTGLDRSTPPHVQAYAVAWTVPYRVDCMSLTSALAFGFDRSYCSSACGPTKPSAYFNSASHRPFDELGMRPSMLLAGKDFKQVKALIDRGIAADYSFPKGRGYLVITSDMARNVRASRFEQAARELEGVFPVEVVEAEAITDRHDVLFYFTGRADVEGLETIDFLPGALADHLTSAGGQLTGSSQMSSLRWLEAGATASYGTVVEPCNHVQKFPFPGIAMFHYALGASALEAYWKSVAWPGEGVFIGEPLARPFAPRIRKAGPGQFELHVFSPRSGRLRFERSISAAGPFRPLPRQVVVGRGENVIRFNFSESEGYLRLRW